jgi:hypothetical protein
VIGVPVLLHEKPWIGDEPGAVECHNSTPPFICPELLVELMRAGNVTLLDARPPPTTFTRQPGLGSTIPGAVRAEWQEFMRPAAGGDELMMPDEMAAVFRSKGVSRTRPVVVFGGWSAQGFWGEEGRIWWQLWWLNHMHVHILYGGVWAWDPAVHKVLPSPPLPCLPDSVAIIAARVHTSPPFLPALSRLFSDTVLVSAVCIAHRAVLGTWLTVATTSHVHDAHGLVATVAPSILQPHACYQFFFFF